jgi:hypothetical protein
LVEEGGEEATGVKYHTLTIARGRKRRKIPESRTKL